MEVPVNLTLAVDEAVAGRARKAAQAMGKSLNQVVREYLEPLAGDAVVEVEIAEFEAMSGRGDSGGARFDRTSSYSERLDRYRGA
ncbi:MAG: MerR family transcriptional regulator [Xanthomonadales bacterium]|nr:MerR family transcriptional regulator [Xanthomonadales bacterium]MCE7931314.1 MerR family transcriptional regulator [Xanthomonadales bacterium PRO6]